MQLVVLIPAYKPDDKLLRLLEELVKTPYADILVIDDGSGEAYAPIFDAAHQMDGVTVMGYAVNRGKGGALKYGLAHIAQSHPDHAVVTADADGQHTPGDILKVAQRTMEAGDAFVVGGRRFDKDVPARSRVGNTFMRYAFLLSTRRKLHDTQSGLRGIPAKHVLHVAGIAGDRYEFEMNMLLDIARNGYPMVEVTIRTVYLEHNASSHFSPVRDALRVLVPVVKFIASSLTSTGVDYVMYALLMEAFSFPARNAYVLARAISAIVNFTLNKTLVFHGKGDTLKQLLKYALLVGIIMTLGYFGVRWLTALGVNSYFAKMLVDTLLFFLSFTGQRLLVFRVKSHTKRELKGV